MYFRVDILFSGVSRALSCFHLSREKFSGWGMSVCLSSYWCGVPLPCHFCLLIFLFAVCLLLVHSPVFFTETLCHTLKWPTWCARMFRLQSQCIIQLGWSGCQGVSSEPVSATDGTASIAKWQGVHCDRGRHRGWILLCLVILLVTCSSC